MATRLKDIARSLNLSISTVSAALQDRADISPATRARVLKKVRQLNYQPNVQARSLVTRRTHILGVIVPDLSCSFFAEVLKGIDLVTSASGYTLLVCNTDENASREDDEISTLISQRVDGLIIASAHKPNSVAFVKRVADLGVPCVLVDRRFPKTYFVGGDDERIGYLATRHLIDQGYRKVAHLAGPHSIATAIGRRQGYLQALREYGHDATKAYIVEAPYRTGSGAMEAMRRLLSLPDPPDAVFAASDPIAIGAMQAILRAGLQPGPDVGLIGVGGHRYGEFLSVPLSTVDQRRSEIGRDAGALLLDLVGKKQARAPQAILVEPELIIRSSSGRGAIRSRGTPTFAF